jgi:peptidoglycan/LPS O-acetylase OafA/YrhL
MIPALARPTSPGAGSQTPVRLAPINGLRGIAILAVIYFHIIMGLWPADAVPIWLSPLLTNGWTGVNLFFILSGFVLYLPYAAGAREMNNLSDQLRFYRHRFLRLLPLFYIAAITEWLLAAPHGGGAELFSVVSLAFIFEPHTFTPRFNPALWSIGVEIAFSALLPLLLRLEARLGAMRLLAVVLILALVTRLAGISRYPALQGATFNSDMFLCRLDEFVIGMVLAHLYIKRRLPWDPRWCALAGTALIALAWIGFDLVLRGILPPLGRAVLNNVLDAGLFLVVFAALVPGTPLATALCWRPMQVLGMMCYSIYIWQGPLLDWLMPDRAAMSAGAFAVRLSLFIAATLAVAALSYRFIEFGRASAWRPLFLLNPRARSADGALNAVGRLKYWSKACKKMLKEAGD